MDIMRKQFTIRIAGLTIGIDTVSTSACVLCRDYLCEGEPDFVIRVKQEDIEKEIHECERIKHTHASAENLAIYRKIVDEAINYDTILMHGAVIAENNDAYMFSAPSGTGKTTHIKLWLENNDKAFVVNGDKPLIRIIDNKAYACGTPWSGSEGMNTNIMVELKSIVIMRRGDDNHIEKMNFLKAYPYLLQQTHMSKDADKAKRTIEILSSLCGKVSVWYFECNNFKEDCYKTAFNALVNG